MPKSIRLKSLYLIIIATNIFANENRSQDHTTDPQTFADAVHSEGIPAEHYAKIKNQFINLLVATKINSLSITINPSVSTYQDLIFNEENQEQLLFLQEILHCPTDPLTIPKGIVVNGPRGNGRKNWIYSLASKIGASVISINCFGLIHLYSYVAAGYIQQLFELANLLNQLQGQNGQTFIIFDNLEMIAAKNQPTQNCLTESIDLEFKKMYSHKDVKTFVFAVTEDYSRIDSRLFGSDKLGFFVNFQHPSLTTRTSFISRLANIYELDSTFNLNEWADRCEGFSFAQIQSIFQSAAWNAKQHDKTIFGKLELSQAIDQMLKICSNIEDKDPSMISSLENQDQEPCLNVQVWPQGSVSTRFDDVVADPSIKQEVLDVLMFVKHPERFERTKGKIPNGIVLYGPTGTGKTLFAKALAGEAGCSFISVNASLLTSKYLGDSSKNIKRLFNLARRMAKAEGKPSIIFCDEIDSFAMHRGSSYGTVNDDNRQMLNQFLCELDGFGTEHGQVIVIAATNRFEDLDPAVLRPGRLERHICMDLPSLSLREEILERTRHEFNIDPNTNMHEIAKITTSFSGADIKNMVNEAAIIAAKENSSTILQEHLLKAHDKVILGVENRSKKLTTTAMLETAYHEAGHALVSIYNKYATPLKRITCIPRGNALGVTSCYPDEDIFSKSKENLFADLMSLYGGAIAEELLTGTLSTGASNDFKKATYLAKKYVCDFGMSELGFIHIPEKCVYNKEVLNVIHKLLKKAKAECCQLLSKHKFELICFAHQLVEKETMSYTEVVEWLKASKEFESFLQEINT